MQRYDSLVHLKEYLGYRLAIRDYETKLATANKEVEELRKIP